jgi:hypothetical protein
LDFSSPPVNGFVEERFDTGSLVEEIMETLISSLYIIAGLLLRLAIPILGTVLLVVFLRKLDKRWQAEAALLPQAVQKPECWKIQGCASQQVENCEAYQSELPCWQVYRLPNGYLHEECLSCQVFTEAPIPTLKPEARRM